MRKFAGQEIRFIFAVEDEKCNWEKASSWCLITTEYIFPEEVGTLFFLR